MGIGKLDTVKDKNGMRFRVVDIQTNDGQITAILKGIHSDNSPRRGAARKVRADVLERDYTRIDLPPVTIRKIDDLSEEEKQVVKESTPSEKAAQIEKEAVRELSKKDIEKAVDVSTFGGPKKPTDDIIVVPHGTQYDIIETLAEHRRYIKELEGDKEILKAEILDMKKSISKMKQAHEAEVQDLKDQLMEAQAMANAANKYKDEVVAERNRYSESLDDDSVTFEEVLELAETMQLMSTGTAKLAKQIIEKMEGRI